ncbi:DUF6086 family protein [Streptomyces sp. NPDC093591]|uniref:DUF6086 family protein n=1 Tax=Streptomyces sp. NPDC093591 TaxID=3366044 RepID=UPI0038059F7A
MSQYFDIGDETLWNPSNGAARLFLRCVRLYEEELGVPSGFGAMENDECAIDPRVFESFVNTLLLWHAGRSHRVIDALSRGFTATVLVLAERARIEVRWPEPSPGPEGRSDVQVPMPDQRTRWDTLRESAAALSRSMPV